MATALVLQGVGNGVARPSLTAVLTNAVDEIASRLAQAPATPVREAKALIDKAHLRGLDEGMDAEAEAQMRCMSDEGFADAVMSGVQRLSSRG